MLNKIINKLNYWMLFLTKPGMIYGIKHKGRFLKNTRISNTTVIENKNNLTLSDNVFIGHYNFIEASHDIEIGVGCQITNFISIISHSSHNSIRIYGSKYRDHKDHIGYLKGPVKIGSYTFIGPHSLIMPNSKIGKGSLVQAYSLVKGDFPEYSIIGGNPAKVIGNTKEVDEKFLEENAELKSYYKEWAEKKE